MRIKTTIHEITDPKTGAVKGGGAVETRGRVSQSGNGCGLESCHCSDIPFVSIVMPLDNQTQTVTAVTVHFSDHAEYRAFVAGSAIYHD